MWWLLLGLVIAGVAFIPVARFLLARAERRARDAERRARDAERLAELGSMTGGLAHEIKNPLSTVGLNAQLLSEGIAEAKLPQDEQERLLRRLGSLRREVDRLRDILTDFLQFAGRMRLDPQSHDVASLVEETCDFYLPQCRQAGVVLRTQLPDRPIKAMVDSGLFKQALLNLLLNATQAMSAGDGGATPDGIERGDLILKVESDESEARIHVIDTGPGIESQRLREIFRPYVSGRSGGSGLGLPTARRIIEEHGGRLEAHSDPGQGSEFVIHLPLRQGDADD